MGLYYCATKLKQIHKENVWIALPFKRHPEDKTQLSGYKCPHWGHYHTLDYDNQLPICFLPSPQLGQVPLVSLGQFLLYSNTVLLGLGCRACKGMVWI